MLTRQLVQQIPVFGAISDPVEQVLDRLWSGTGSGDASRGAGTIPALNAWEDEQAIHIEAELPGYAEKDVDISVTGRELTITGMREVSYPEGATVHRRERSSTKFSRTLRLGTNIDTQRVSAHMDAGVLTITLAKSEEARPRKIKITAG